MGLKRQRLMDQGSSYYGTPGPSYMYNAPPPPPPSYSYIPPPFPVVRLRGLPFDCAEAEIVDFFHGLDVIDVLFVHKGGKFTGEAYCVLGYPLQLDFALQRNRQNIGKRYVEVFRSRKDEYYKAIANEVFDAPGGSPRRGAPRARSSDDTRDLSEFKGLLRLRGLPFSCTREEIINFFKDFKLSEDKIHLIANSEGRPAGEAFVEFSSPEDSRAAMSKDRMTLGYRYIELFPASREELEEAASRGRWVTISYSISFSVIYVRHPDPKLVHKVAWAKPEKCWSRKNALISGTGSSPTNKLVNPLSGPLKGFVDPTADIHLYCHHWFQDELCHVVLPIYRELGFRRWKRLSRGLGVERGKELDVLMNVLGFKTLIKILIVESTTSALAFNADKLKPKLRDAMVLIMKGDIDTIALLPKSFEGKDPTEPTPILRMRGLPFSAGKDDIIDFFKNFRLPEESIHIIFNFEGRPTGEAFVEFASVDDAKAALAKDRMTLGSRYIELFPSSAEELNEAASRGR
ncbi:UNVERIFIED_CONTAM: Heterogeneous nuclear ribonucleoprotein F [Sesamum indicum]